MLRVSDSSMSYSRINAQCVFLLSAVTVTFILLFDKKNTYSRVYLFNHASTINNGFLFSFTIFKPSDTWEDTVIPNQTFLLKKQKVRDLFVHKIFKKCKQGLF